MFSCGYLPQITYLLHRAEKLLVPLEPVLLRLDLLLERGDHGEVVERDVVVVVLHVGQRALVLLPDAVDLDVFPLLCVAHLGLQSKV